MRGPFQSGSVDFHRGGEKDGEVLCVCRARQPRPTKEEPDEVRTKEFFVPKKVVGVRASLAYHLVPGKADKDLGVTVPRVQPVTVVSADVERRRG